MEPKFYTGTEVAAFYGPGFEGRQYDAAWYFKDEDEERLLGPFRNSEDCMLAMHHYRRYLDVPRGRAI